jgi:hypothetical protein
MSDTLSRIMELLTEPLAGSEGSVVFPFDVETFCRENDELIEELREEAYRCREIHGA